MPHDQTHHARKLAVILHADVVGSTALVQKNEVIAHQRIQDAFHQFSKIIEDYGGIAHEIRGDALVAEFRRASDSVCAALAFQVENSIKNKESTDDIQCEIRIGISVAEVVIADGTITGAGVVLAQRLEQLSEPGGVVVQGTVSETVPVRLPFTFKTIGEHNLKGFDHPVRAFTVQTNVGEVVPNPENDNVVQKQADPGNEVSQEPARTETSRPSIAVLPFTNMSGDPEQEYFSDGITEDIITEFSRFHDLFVIARNSSFVFKNQSVDITEVGHKLGVQYVVEGSVRKSGNRVRITAQLINVATGNHIWADRYDRDLEDIFEVQDEVVRIITSTLVGRVAHAHRDLVIQKPTVNLDAYDWLVQGRELFYNGMADDNMKACEMFEKAIALDPDYAAAYALLAESYIRDWVTFWKIPLAVSHDKAWENAKKALKLDDTDSKTHTALGVVNLFAGDSDQAYLHLNKAISLNPGDTHAFIYMSRYETMAGNPEQAIKRVTEARSHNPFGKYDWSYVPAFFVAQRYSEAIEVMRGIQNPAPYMLCWMAALYAQAGETDRANAAITAFIETTSAQLLSVGTPLPASWLEFIAERWRFTQQKDMAHFLDGLRMAGLPE